MNKEETTRKINLRGRKNEKLDLRLASNPDWWERNENYAKVLKPNAPKEAQDSYQHFLEQCKYYDKIYGKGKWG